MARMACCPYAFIRGSSGKGIARPSVRMAHKRGMHIAPPALGGPFGEDPHRFWGTGLPAPIRRRADRVHGLGRRALSLPPKLSGRACIELVGDLDREPLCLYTPFDICYPEGKSSMNGKSRTVLQGVGGRCKPMDLFVPDSTRESIGEESIALRR